MNVLTACFIINHQNQHLYNVFQIVIYTTNLMIMEHVHHNVLKVMKLILIHVFH